MRTILLKRVIEMIENRISKNILVCFISFNLGCYLFCRSKSHKLVAFLLICAKDYNKAVDLIRERFDELKVFSKLKRLGEVPIQIEDV
jgi:hypothetical protein